MKFQYLANLPIHEKRDEIVQSIRTNQVTIISGETGSGKTTQLPLLCLEAGRGVGGKIGCTQPRRIAAISLSRFVASQFDSTQQHRVGYKIRHDKSCGPDTLITFMTDGILLAEIGRDLLLSEYDTILIDEAHERSINIDFLLGYMRLLLQQREDLHLIISSATIDTKLFSRIFHHAPVITVSGRLFPIQIRYKPAIELWKGESMDCYIEGIVSSVREIIDANEEGDILIFLPTIDDIMEALHRLKAILPEDLCRILPLHSRMTPALQQRIFEKCNLRTIVIATNIAETSITVPGIRFVIDSGLARMLRYDPSIGFSRMPVERISKAAADQRAGRCGRVRDGVCVRLFSETDYFSRPSFTTPELRRANLSGVILRMLHLGLGDIARYPFPQQSSPRAIFDGYRQLKELGAIDRKKRLTSLGKKMALFPLDPTLSRILIYAQDHGALHELLIITAALSVNNLTTCHDEDYVRSSLPFRHQESDFMTFLNLWNALPTSNTKARIPYSALKPFCEKYRLSVMHMQEWYETHRQLQRICQGIHGFYKKQNAPASYAAIHKSLLAGLIHGVAARTSAGSYQGTHTEEIAIFPSSSLFSKNPTWVLFQDIVETKKVYGRNTAIIKPQWIEEMFRNQCRYTHENSWFDAETGIVCAYEEVTYHGLELVKNRVINLAGKNRPLANEIFIREALVKEQAGDRYRFIRHNRELRDTISVMEKKIRQSLYVGDSVLEAMYEERLPDVTQVRELNKCIRDHDSDTFLMFSIDDLTDRELPSKLQNYPDEIVIAGHRIPVTYEYKPGKDLDGAGVVISDALFQAIPLCYWEWLLPVYWEDRIAWVADLVVQSNPEKDLDAAHIRDHVLQLLNMARGEFCSVLINELQSRYGILIDADIIKQHLPAYLWVHVTVKDSRGSIVHRFRASQIPTSARNRRIGKRSAVWVPYCSHLEADFSNNWADHSFLMAQPLSSPNQLVELAAIPALSVEGELIRVRIFFSYADAWFSHAEAVRLLLEQELAEDLAWELESFRIPQAFVITSREFMDGHDPGELVAGLFIKKVLKLPSDLPCEAESFFTLVQDASIFIPRAHQEVLNLLESIISAYGRSIALFRKRSERHASSLNGREELWRELLRYRSLLFEENVPIGFVEKIPEYLSGIVHRIDSCFLEPREYLRKMERVNRDFEEITSMWTDSAKPQFLWEQQILREDLLVTHFSENRGIQKADFSQKALHLLADSSLQHH